MGQVTIVARCDRVVAGFRPAGVLIVHDVAVDARLGIVAEIAQPFRVIERVRSQANANADQDRAQKDQRRFESQSFQYARRPPRLNDLTSLARFAQGPGKLQLDSAPLRRASRDRARKSFP